MTCPCDDKPVLKQPNKNDMIIRRKLQKIIRDEVRKALIRDRQQRRKGMKISELRKMIREIIQEEINEKWAGDVDVKSTGQYADKTVADLKKSIAALKAKETSTEADKKKMGQLLFALRAKQGWKKGKGATGVK